MPISPPISATIAVMSTAWPRRLEVRRVSRSAGTTNPRAADDNRKVRNRRSSIDLVSRNPEPTYDATRNPANSPTPSKVADRP